MYTPEEWHQTQLQIVAELFENKENKGKLKFIACPPRSPDLNPIELVWDGLGKLVTIKQPSGESHLWAMLECWNGLAKQCLTSLLKNALNLLRFINANNESVLAFWSKLSNMVVTLVVYVPQHITCTYKHKLLYYILLYISIYDMRWAQTANVSGQRVCYF